MVAINCGISQTGHLSKTITLRFELKIMLITNTGITDHLINRQIEVVKYFRYFGDKFDIINIKFDDINADKKLIQTGYLSRHNSWVPIKRTEN